MKATMIMIPFIVEATTSTQSPTKETTPKKLTMRKEEVEVDTASQLTKDDLKVLL